MLGKRREKRWNDMRMMLSMGRAKLHMEFRMEGYKYHGGEDGMRCLSLVVKVWYTVSRYEVEHKLLSVFLKETQVVRALCCMSHISIV